MTIDPRDPRGCSQYDGGHGKPSKKSGKGKPASKGGKPQKGQPPVGKRTEGNGGPFAPSA